jgi:phospholipid/cholesterol/gamma-HCH transport system permease protein
LGNKDELYGETTAVKTQSSVSYSMPSDDLLCIHFAGDWMLSSAGPSTAETRTQIESGTNLRGVTFDAGQLKQWDSSLLIFLREVMDVCRQRNIKTIQEGLPEGVRRLLELASPEHQRKAVTKGEERKTFFVGVADATFGLMVAVRDVLAFIGGATVAVGRLLSGRANFRGSDLLLFIRDVGAGSLPIVSLISVLVGLILAFVGAIQLKLFGAQIYVADVVGIGMVRVMGAIMAGVIMAGRTGAAFAAQLGTMQVNEEIDALETLGISPMEFLVLPRMVALTLMMPLLCLYADLMGIVGGAVVGVGMLNLNIMEYYEETKTAVSLTYLWVGLFHSFVFGIIIALSGCLRGMQCGRSASEVGYATTSAVVTAIVGIIVATAIITFACNVLGI